MGYMGFGMRKEVYTRKAKKAFKKLKEVYGDNVDTPDSKAKTRIKGPTKYVKHTYKPFFQSRPYIIFKRIVFISIIITVIWVAFLSEPFFKYQQNRFEQKDFANLYQEQLDDYQEVFNFLESRSEKIKNVSRSYYRNRYDILIQNAGIDESPNHYIKFYGLKPDNKTNNDIIFQGTLTIERKGYLPKTYQNNWEYRLIEVTPQQIPNSVLEYLETSKTELSGFLNNIKEIDETFHVKADSIVTSYDHDKYGWYTFVYTSQELKSNFKIDGKYKYNTYVGKLDENVYWVRKEREKRSKK